MRLNSNLARAALVAGMLAALVGVATPTQIYQKDQTGNFVLFGNTMGIDCQFTNASYPIPQPVVGTVGDCGSAGLTDSAPDVFWRSDDPDAGTAFADVSVTAAQARTTAVLSLPSGAGITYARLFWGAHNASTNDYGRSVTVERPGVFSSVLTADDGMSAVDSTRTTEFLYQSSVDVTALLQQYGPGAYRVGGFDSAEFANVSDDSLYAGWTIVVFYASDNEATRQLTLFESLDQINGAGSSVTSTITGFQVPNTSNFAAILGVVAYEGDWSLSGDQFKFNGSALAHGAGTDNNFFDGSRTEVSAQSTVSHVGDLPQLTGGSGSNTGIDVHALEIPTMLLHAGDTSATVQSTSSGDFYVLGMFVTAISTLKPVFVDTFKHFTDLNGGDIRKGDVIEYTISTVNSGSDTGQSVTLTDVLPAQVTYVPGTLQIVSTNAGGAPVGPLTDDVGDDTGQFDSSTNTVTVWLGAGAASGTGGTVDTVIGTPPGTPRLGVTIKFQVTLNSTDGEVINQAQISTTSTNSAAGTATFLSDMTDTGAGIPTSFGIDECSVDSDCTTTTKPLCDVAAQPNRCVQCLSASNCSGALPVCDATSGTCVGCTADAQCTDAALPRCDLVHHDCAAPLPVTANAPHFEGGGCGGCSGTGSPVTLMLGALTTVFLMGRRRKTVS